NHPEGYIARYGADGRFQWVQHLGPSANTYVWGLAARADGTTLAAVANTNPRGFVLAPGVLDFPLGAGDGALVSLGPDGRFLHAVRYAPDDVDDLRIAVLADGGVLLSGVSVAGSVLGKGTPMEQHLMPGMFYARFTPELALDWVRVVTVPSRGYGTALLPDGS